MGEHRDMDADDLSARTTKAYACNCASHQQAQCSYFRMGYCTDRVHGATRTKPVLVVNNGGSIGAALASRIRKYDQ